MEKTKSLEITVTSAKGLKNVNHLSKMDVFVAVKLSGDPKCSDDGEQRTQVAKDSGTSPKFSNDVLKLSIDQALAEANRLVVTFKIRCEQRGGDKDIAEVHVPVKELLDHLGNEKTGQRYVTYKIKKPNGKPNGDISFTYSFCGDGPVVVKSGEGCSRYIVHEPVSPSDMYQPVSPLETHQPVSPPATYGSDLLNGPVLSMLLPNDGSFSYGPSMAHHETMPQASFYGLYPSMAHQEIMPQTTFYGLYPPQGYPTSYITENPPAMYPTAGAPLFPGLLYPPEGYPTVAQPQQTGLYPPMNPYGF